MFIHLALAVLVHTAATDRLPVRSPNAVGMSAERLANINRVVKRAIDAGGFPGASVVIGRRGAAVVQKGFGRLGWTASSPEVDAERTIYDLASLTKVVGTATAAMVLFDEGRLDLDAPVSHYIPAFSGGLKDNVTVRHLLTHRSGLPAGRELWRIASNPADARRIVLETPLACRPGACFVYSDLGADVMGWVIETIAGQRLDVFLHERVFAPLGMNDTFFKPSDSLQYRVAPTEITPPRGYPLKGEVHDENAYALGGVAGHAGLFSTAADLAIYAQMMLNGGEYDGVRIVSDSAVERFTRRVAGTRALGWDTAEGQGGSGQYLTERAFGHTGYTGTSIWIDPDREMFVVLLTNRVHAARARRPAKVIADVRADLADAAALAVVEDGDSVLRMPASFRADRADGWNPSVRRSRTARSSKSARSRAAAAKRRSKATASKATTSKATAKKPAVSKATASKATASKATASKATASKATASKATTSKASAAKPTASKATISKSTASKASSKSPAPKSKSSTSSKSSVSKSSSSL